jgi:hypothetical protein
MRETKIIAVFDACGRKYFQGKYSNDCSSCNLPMSWFRFKKRVRTEEEIKAACDEFYKIPRLIGKEGYINSIKDKEITVLNEEYPTNYINRIKSEMGKYDYIFVEADLSLMTAMLEKSMDFILVYPDINAKTDWIGRCIVRGDSLAICNAMKWTWEPSIKNLYEFSEYHPEIPTYVLKNGQYLSDVVEMIEKDGENARTITLTKDEIDCFNWYLENAKMDIAFGNSDWTAIYKKIVGDQVSEYAERKMNYYPDVMNEY